jgi:asparagine synthase (glutamine-hydrolysing)
MNHVVSQCAERSRCRIVIHAECSWRRFARGNIELWAKGYGAGVDGDVMLTSLMNFTPSPRIADLAALVGTLDGHFALAARGPGWAFAAVDYVRSIPLAFARCGGQWYIDDQALRLRDSAGLGVRDVDPDAALALGMAGYTIDIATLYRGLQQLAPGELVLLVGDDEPQRHRYYCYRPWRADKPAYDPAKARKALAEMTLAVIDGMMKGIGDRILVVPLSAGRDSRLIVSAARHLGYRNIRTFAYGHPGNHEAKASQAIAERLGIPGRFVPSSIAAMRRYFADGTHASYCAFADTLQSVPFVQDLTPIALLKADGFIPTDAVIANGNSGDYISGAHIVPEMHVVADGLLDDERLKRITTALIKKHFGLWAALQTPDHRARIERQLLGSLARAGATLGDPADDYGLYEYAEFQDRQCKYVISGQRIYEFLGHEWRLPLWDKVYLDFFERIPLAGKVGQRLYADMLDKENWGGVWHDVPVNAKTIRPHWLRPLRFLAKLAHAPLSADAWHRFERRYVQYWMGGAQSAIRPYRVVASDRRGARNAVAWLTEAYLHSHGLSYDGSPLQPDMAPGRQIRA